VLSGYVPEPVRDKKLQPIGRLDGTTNLHLAIGLPLRNAGALTNLLHELYSPDSTNFHRYLTPQQFRERFGPLEQDYQKVIDFAKVHGLKTDKTYGNRLVLDVSGKASDIENAFHVTLRTYRHPTEPRDCFAPDVEPSVDAGVLINVIEGLESFNRPHSNLHVKPVELSGTPRPNWGSAPNGFSYMGYDFRNAYAPGVSLDGTGQWIGLAEYGGYNESDITAYEQLAGLPNVLPLDDVVEWYYIDPGTYNQEVSLDIEMAISMAPGANIYVVQGWFLGDILGQLASQPQVQQISFSYSYSYYLPNNGEGEFQELAAQGQSVFIASGDNDANSISWPEDHPWATIVGGTTLMTTHSQYVSETVWNWNNGTGSDGGASTRYGIPSWQQMVTNLTAVGGSTTMRNIPDVALTADDILVVDNNGQQANVGGTSAAAPLWAGFTALINQQLGYFGKPPAGFLNPALYSIGMGPGYSNCFHDITISNNTSASSPNQYFAASGYDLCTGWGTPNGMSLIEAFVGIDHWMSTISGKWETASNWSLNNWSLSALPYGDAFLDITNANTKTVTIDATTALSNTVNGCLYIGSLTVSAPPSSVNTLALSNAGTLSNPLLVKGPVAVEAGGVVTVVNSTLDVDSSSGSTGIDGVSVGVITGGNSLLITNGGALYDNYGFVGQTPASDNNVVLVTDPGSVWNNAGNLFVGNGAVQNRLWVHNGGAVSANTLTLGANAGGQAMLLLDGGVVNVAGLVAMVTNSLVQFTCGTLSSSGTTMTNSLLIGDAVDAATFQLNGGVHSFANGLEIRNNASLMGCGTINGNVVVDPGGTVLASCGGTLTFTGIVTNNGTMQLVNGTVLEGYGLVVNNGLIDIGGGTTNFHGGFINNGIIGAGTNKWSAGSGKWESTANWSRYRAPSVFDPSDLVTNANTKTVTVDATTALSNAMNGCMTVNNLVVSGPSGTVNTLFLNKAGTHTPLQVLNTLTIDYNAALTVNNSSLTLPSPNESLWLGVWGMACTLQITNGGQVSDSYAYEGYYGQSSNVVLVTGAGSVWSNQSTLYVGYFGCGNQLTVANSGALYDSNAIVGYTLASNNVVLVTGAGSVWASQSALYVGYWGADNQLTIANGGEVFDTNGYLGYYSAGSNNLVTVTGPGSVWANQSAVYVGYDGVGNRLTIANGAQVGSQNGYVGYDQLSYCSNNVVVVTDPGSIWSNQYTLYVGCSYGAGNQLIVTNGGAVLANDLDLGPNLACQGTLTLAGGTVNVVGLTSTNATGVVAFNSGTLASSGTTMTGMLHGPMFAVGDAVNAATFQLNGGLHSFYVNLEIRNNATLTGCGTVSGNVLVDAGGTVLATCGGTLSFTGIVTNNGTITTIPGTIINFLGLMVNNGTIVAANGGVNFLGGFINNGSIVAPPNSWIDSTGKWETAGNWSLGGAPGGLDPADLITNGNTKTVTIDANTVLSNTVNGCLTINNLTISAPSGSTNTLALSNSGTLSAPLLIEGTARLGGGGVITVTNSTLEVDRTSGGLAGVDGVLVGVKSSGNTLAITNGGALYDNNGILGSNSTSSGNSVVVAGVGSVWSNSSTLVVGLSGAGNQLTVSNGGQVVNLSWGILGNSNSSSNNTVLVTGTGSVWKNAASMEVGSAGPNNQVTIANGGKVFSAGSYIGGISMSNVVLVTDSGSVWSNTTDLIFSDAATDNQLIVTNNGAVLANRLVFPVFSRSSGTLTLAGGIVNVAGLIFTNPSGTVVFNSGTLLSSGTVVSNLQPFAVGDALNPATFQLNGGVHSFAKGLEIRNNAELTGCGTINGSVVVDPGGTVQAACGGTLTFGSIVTNNGTMRAINGSTLEAYGLVVNNGIIDISGGKTNFHGGFINNGTVCPLTITTSSSPSGGGTTSGGGVANCGSNVTVTAIPNACYNFVDWTVNGTVVGSNTSYSFTAITNEALVANFVTSINAPVILTNLHLFGGPDGMYPYAGLVQGSDSNFYGTTYQGGAYGSGTVFRIGLNGSFTTLYSFSGTDGGNPEARLVQGSDSNFYGATHNGGTYGNGTVFRIGPSGSFTNLYSFGGAPNGATPNAALVQGNDGNLYGTTRNGGTYGNGTVFRIGPSGSFTNLYSFGGAPSGAAPDAELVQGNDGNLYGTTRLGGANNDGTVYRISLAGILTNLHSFSGTDGMYPYAGLVQGGDGNFYGTTYSGGTSNVGTVFRIGLNGNFTTLYSFSGTDGGNPYAGLVQGTDGNFYGTTYSGGTSNAGTVFRMGLNGSITTLYSFSGKDGTGPRGGLVQGTDGNFYGTTYSGGASGVGTAFELSNLPTTVFSGNPTEGLAPLPVNFVDCSAGTITNRFWSFGDGITTNITTTTVTHIYPPGNFSVTLVVTGPFGVSTNTQANYILATGANISTTVSPPSGGTTSGGGAVPFGSNLTVCATANPCYNFVNWTLNSNVVSSLSCYSFTAASNENLVANFAPITYTINTSSSASQGTTSGGGIVNCGSNVTVTAIANACYSFANWTVNGTVVSSSASYSFIPSASETLVANFIPITNTISTSSSPPFGGTISGGGSVLCGSYVTVTATPNACYSFVNWTLNGSVVSSNANYSFVTSSNLTLVANFTPIACTINTSSSPTDGGSTSGGGAVNCGSNLTVCATPNSCYRFADWTLDGSGVSTSSCYPLTATSNETLVANFAPTTYTISTSSSPSAGGSTAGGGLVPCGSNITVTAVASACYNFVDWTVNGIFASSNTSYSFTPNANETLVANFGPITSTLTLADLYSFSGPDGSRPVAGLIQASDGYFYGTTFYGGAYGSGTVFRIGSSGILTNLHSFNGPDGASPWAALVQASDGNFYGTTGSGGTKNDGTVFKITSQGTLSTLYQFIGGTNGAIPIAGLVQGTDGNFYGTTELGGTTNLGTVFRITPSGSLTNIHSFIGSDGADPVATLVLGSDGNFYGTTEQGGSIHSGTVFRISSSGSFTSLYSFTGGSDGGWPYAGAPLVQGSDSNFYGTTWFGGTYSSGTVFRISPSGDFTTLHSFNNSDGARPHGGLVQGNDGNFYSTTYQGGVYGSGTVFRISSSANFTNLYSFSGSDGGFPDTGMTLGSDGNFYGTTGSGGTNRDGVVFELTVASAPQASFTASPTVGAAPLSVNFTDISCGSITGWAWAFGDSDGSSSQNPTETYLSPGNYTVQVIVSGPGGSSTSTVVRLISVYDPFAWWQQTYFGSTNNSGNAAPPADYTGTGMSNTNKFLAGFNPTNPAAYLHIISIVAGQTNVVVTYLGPNGDNSWTPGIASRTNVLEFTAGTASGNYSNDFASTGQTNILSGGDGVGVVTNMVDSGGATNTPSRYYRVRVLLP
jgi:T5SS/PEP-CTERM-associated repeat protein/uncharacterized repeat protein (TIGR03803 family)